MCSSTRTTNLHSPQPSAAESSVGLRYGLAVSTNRALLATRGSEQRSCSLPFAGRPTLEYAVTLGQGGRSFRLPVRRRHDHRRVAPRHDPLSIDAQEVRRDADGTAYTGLLPKTVPGGNLDVIEGSEVSFHLAFDREVREAYVLVSDPLLRGCSRQRIGSSGARCLGSHL